MELARLYARYVSFSFRSQMQYQLSFVMQSIALLVMTGVEFAGVYFLFERFGSLRGWRLPEVALLYGVVNVAFAFSESFARGFDTFPNLVKQGDFDRLLLRPRGTVFQVLAREVQLMRVGRFLQGALVLGWAMRALDTHWTLDKLALLAWSLVGGVCLFSGLFIMYATLAFFTVEALELLNIVTYGGVETAQYPMAIYTPGFRTFFTFVIPLACVAYLPGLSLMNRRPEGIANFWLAVAPLAGVVFFAVSLQVWKFGVHRYTSTGS